MLGGAKRQIFDRINRIYGMNFGFKRFSRGGAEKS